MAEKLATDLLTSADRLNNLDLLLQQSEVLVNPFTNLKSQNELDAHTAIQTLAQLFTMLKDIRKPIAVYQTIGNEQQEFIQSKCKQYVDWMLNTLEASTPSLQISKLTALISLVKTQSEIKSQGIGQWVFHTVFYQRIIDCFLLLGSKNHCIDTMIELLNFDDLRFYFYRCIVNHLDGKIEFKSNRKQMFVFDQEILRLLLSIPGGEDFSADECLNLYCQEGKLRENHDLNVAKVTRAAYSDCWLKLLRLPLSQPVYRKILQVIHKKIIPFMSQPTLLIDFLTDSYNQGGIISLLALNGLFILVQEHNLDYPDFFTKVYSLLDANILHVQYKSRFFRMLQLFLSSSLLPSITVAAFIKRLARLCLFAPPSGILIVLPMIYNLLRIHPSCIKLIHFQGEFTTEQFSGMNDPFSFEAVRPEDSMAESSYLWELTSLKQHYHPSVATMAKIFEEPLTQPEYDLEDFLDLNYDELVQQEMKSKQPEAAMMTLTGDLLVDDDLLAF